MNTTTYILSAPTKRDAIVFIFRNFKAGKQSFPVSIASAPIRLKKFCHELGKTALLIDQSYASNLALYITNDITVRLSTNQHPVILSC